jgi:hypothetical protein
MRISTVEIVERIAMDYYKQEIEAEEQRKPRPAIPLLKADDQHGFSKRDPTIDKKAAIFKVIFGFICKISMSRLRLYFFGRKNSVEKFGRNFTRNLFPPENLVSFILLNFLVENFRPKFR